MKSIEIIKYKPQSGDLVMYNAKDIPNPIVGMITDIYEEDIEGYGLERLYRIEWYDEDEEGLGSYGYSLVQANQYRDNYLEYRRKHAI